MLRFPALFQQCQGKEEAARAAHAHSQVLKQLLKQTSIQMNGVCVMIL